ncbi:MAG: hypothetical protein HY650_01205 [Acidobacteria bacterium]|nr:hypothetical protein [Acidobacteriota bacterium]
MNRMIVSALGLVLMISVGRVPAALGSDHDDTPLLRTLNRHDARLTDLHAFVTGEDLVLSLCSNPAIPATATSYRFPSDVTFDFHIDYDSEIRPEDPDMLGGTIVDPTGIREDITYRVRFNPDQSPTLQVIRADGQYDGTWLTGFYAGLRDDPFIRGPRIGRNVAAIVLRVPLASVIKNQSTILIWATSKVDTLEGPFQDLDGRSLRSQEPGFLEMNAMHPSEHLAKMGVKPDVIIYDTSKPVLFPNGRAFKDDVVDMTAIPRIMETDQPFPSANDSKFLEVFPYLAAPNPPPQ